MRISDWSSDVCSSDLRPGDPTNPGTVQTGAAVFETARSADSGQGGRNPPMEGRNNSRGAAMPASAELQSKLFRSEEHTSELQSLMRISYSVFCLKKYFLFFFFSSFFFFFFFFFFFSFFFFFFFF